MLLPSSPSSPEPDWVGLGDSPTPRGWFCQRGLVALDQVLTPSGCGNPGEEALVGRGDTALSRAWDKPWGPPAGFLGTEPQDAAHCPLLVAATRSTVPAAQEPGSCCGTEGFSIKPVAPRSLPQSSEGAPEMLGGHYGRVLGLERFSASLSVSQGLLTCGGTRPKTRGTTWACTPHPASTGPQPAPPVLRWCWDGGEKRRQPASCSPAGQGAPKAVRGGTAQWGVKQL